MSCPRVALALCSALVCVSTVAESRAASEDEVRWRDEWPRFRAWQYAMTPLLFGGAVATRYLAPDPGPSWTGGILFDDAVVDQLSVRDEGARWTTAIATDAIFYAMISYRLLDSTLVPGAIHDEWEVSQQLALIDVQAYSVVAAALWIPQAFVGRDRPIMRRCDDAEVRDHERVCTPGDEHRYRSFVSGHVALAVAAAGLTCIHHANVPLYGGGTWDDVACGAAIGMAFVGAVGRTVTLNHWATDVILGALLGFGAGYLLPAALHYGFDGSGTGSSSAALGAAGPASSPALVLSGSF